MEEKFRKVRVAAVILAIDKTEDDEMVYRYVVASTPDKTYSLPGGYLKKGIGASECLIDYVKEQIGFDIMEAGEHGAILGYSSTTVTDPKLNAEEDVVILFSVRTQLRYLSQLLKSESMKKIVTGEGEDDWEWAFDYLNPEKDPRKKTWEKEWDLNLLVEEIKGALGEDYVEDWEYESDDDEEEEEDEE